MSESATILAAQRRYFNSGATLPLPGRRAALKRLLNAVTAREEEILAALAQDLGKARMEGYLTEVGIVKSELNAMLRHLDRWAKPRRWARSWRISPPAAWSGPSPMAWCWCRAPGTTRSSSVSRRWRGALAAGNCVMIKPGSAAPATAAVIAGLIADAFAPEYVHVLRLGGDSHEEILAEHYDYILFTGSQQQHCP